MSLEPARPRAGGSNRRQSLRHEGVPAPLLWYLFVVISALITLHGMKTVLALVISLNLALAGAVSATPDDDRFQNLANEYIEQTLQAHPEQATELGDHR